MTRNTAREIAIHMVFSLSFEDINAQELLSSQLTKERFEELAPDMPLYTQYPNDLVGWGALCVAESIPRGNSAHL